jgi:hypothetical protein
MMKRLILFTLTLTALTVSGQQLQTCDTTRSYWTFSQNNSFFSIKLLGNVSSTERVNVISIDNYPLQSLLVDKANFLKEGEDNTELKVLIRYAMSEAEYLSNIFKTKINIQLQQAPLSAGKSVLIWFYEMPSGHNQEVKFQLFASIIHGDKIFGLSRPQFADQKFERIRDSLMDLISTLRNVDKDNIDNLCKS